jgi:hypothetical protein
MYRFWKLSLVLVVLALAGGGIYRVLQAHGPHEDVDPHARVIDVFKRNYEVLKKHPDVLGLSYHNGTIRLYTDRPQAVPHEIEGVPITLVESAPTLPPPLGIILLPDDGTHQHLPDVNTCPHPYVEEQRNRWKFCRAPNRAHIPMELMHPPIAGVPVQEAMEVMKRHGEWIMKTPGVTGAGLEANWIRIDTDKPELLPSHIEGIPVKIAPPKQTIMGTGNHSAVFPVNPLAGAMAAAHINTPVGWGTIGGIVLSEGKPWSLFPNHGNNNCEANACTPTAQNPLNACPHNGQDALVHPPCRTPHRSPA